MCRSERGSGASTACFTKTTAGSHTSPTTSSPANIAARPSVRTSRGRALCRGWTAGRWCRESPRRHGAGAAQGVGTVTITCCPENAEFGTMTASRRAPKSCTSNRSRKAEWPRSAHRSGAAEKPTTASHWQISWPSVRSNVTGANVTWTTAPPTARAWPCGPDPRLTPSRVSQCGGKTVSSAAQSIHPSRAGRRRGPTT